MTTAKTVAKAVAKAATRSFLTKYKRMSLRDAPYDGAYVDGRDSWAREGGRARTYRHAEASRPRYSSFTWDLSIAGDGTFDVQTNTIMERIKSLQITHFSFEGPVDTTTPHWQVEIEGMRPLGLAVNASSNALILPNDHSSTLDRVRGRFQLGDAITGTAFTNLPGRLTLYGVVLHRM